MGLVINHNMMAEAAINNLTATYKALGESINALSSGLRINSASDDAAGLAVSEQMKTDIAAITQGIRNANDGISMLQTFDGAASVIDEKLTRMKELAVQASTGTYSSGQRSIMNDEFSAMRDEITRIANATDFNGIKGLNNSAAITIHFGPGDSSAEDFYDVTAKNMTASALGLLDLNIGSQASAGAALSVLDSAVTAKDTARANFGAMINRLTNTIANLGIQQQNIQAAQSQVADVDVASEMSKMVSNQVLAQAGIAMLAQANSIPMMALKLLG
jgi:flagellin